jgi:hypothetical protein
MAMPLSRIIDLWRLRPCTGGRMDFSTLLDFPIVHTI